MAATLDGSAEPLLPDGVVPFPRGFGLARGGWLCVASGIGLSGEGQDNRRVRSWRNGAHTSLGRRSRASLLDLMVAPNGHLVVSSEDPFGAPDAVSSIREYERLSDRVAS